MAYLEQGAIVRISEIASSPVYVNYNTATDVDVVLLNYAHNTINIQEKGRLSFGQLKTQYGAGPYAGWFSHTISTSESTSHTTTLPDNMRAGWERPAMSVTAVDAPELSCAIVGVNDYAREIKLQTLISGYEQDSAITQTFLAEIL